MSNSFVISFDVVAARIQQEVIIINPKYTSEDIVEGLNSGVLHTTIGFVNGAVNYIVDAENNEVAIIERQESEGEYESFEDSSE